MPPFNNNTDDETEMKKRSVSEVAAGITNVLLILIIAFFTCASLWLGVFAIPSFFVFFRASVVAISTVREGINQLQGSIDATHPLAFRSLRFGAAAGLMVTFIAGGLTIFLLELIRYWVLEDNDDAMSVFSGIFRIIGAFVFTHLGVSVLQQGSRMVRSASFYQKEIHDIRTRPETAGGPDRSQMFHLGLGASLREGVISYLYMLPLGGAYEGKHLPLPAVLGAIAGALAARYIAPALLWGGIVGESEGILPDSNAKSWALRREMLTNQYVANLAAKAQGRAAFGESQGGDVKKPGDALYASVASDAEVDDDGVTKNLSQLSAGALREMFQDSNVDPAAFDDMDYAQKRLLLLKSSKVAFAPSTDGSIESDEEDDEPAILTMQNSAQWPSVRSIGDGGSEEKQPGLRPPLIPPHPNGVGSRTIFHRRGQSLVSISEDADGHINRGGYSDQGSGLGLIARGASGGSEASHARSGSSGSAHHARMASNDTPMTQHHQRMRSAMKQGGGSGMTGRSRNQSTASSVRFENDYDDARSVMDGFQHRHLAQVGVRDPSLELEVMEETLSQYSRNRGNGRTISFMPGSPQHTAPGAPISSVDLEESVGGNLALGSSLTSSKRSNGGLLSFMKSSRRVGDSFKVQNDEKENDEEEDEEMGSAGFNGRNAIPNDVADKSFFATIALALSAFVVFGCCAGLLKLGILDFKGLFSDSETEVFDICDISDSCCSPDEQGSVAEMFFAIFNSQFGYTCRETLIGIIAWAAYWLYPVMVCMYATRMCCFSSIPLKEQPQMPVMPERRMAGAYAAAVFSARSTKRFLGGAVPDPARINMHPTHFWIKLSALLNVIAGTAYIWWRAARSMPDDAASPIWNWLFFAGECILMMGVWTSHLQRAFPAVRDVCNMDDLCEIDPGVSKEALVCIMVPTAGEKMKNIKHVLLGAYSQRLWQTAVPTSHQLRVAVLDEKGRHEVRDLVEKVYKLAKSLINPAVQLELSTKFNEPYVTPKIFMDYFNQMDALDKFVFAPVCHPAFDLAVKLENYAGPKAGKFARATSSAAVNTKGKKKTKAANIRLEEGFKEVFNTSPNIPSMIYSARANPGTPKVSPKAGNMNASIFPNSPGEEPVIGDPARIVVVNDARHRLKTEFLQRTVPYFFKLNRRTGKHYEWADVGFVQTPQRFEDLGDGDPLGNHAVLTFFVSNVSKDGVGGVTSCGQGSLWRVDALRGMAADGRQTADHVKKPDIIGHDCGFRSEVLIEDTHTSLEFFKLQWRSAYVCEPGETLAVCVEQPNTVAWRVKQVFRWHIGAVQLLLKDGVTFLCTSRMPTPLHKMFGLDSLTYYIQAVGGLFIILMPIMFSIFQETPFDTVDLQFVYFFFPYILTATIPTLLSVGWKNVNPNRVLTDEQFWLSTCYVQVWALALGLWNRITCANPDNAWNLKCPVWPLGLIFCLLGVSAVNTTVYWMFYLMFDISGIWIFLASFGACIIVMYSIWPMVKLWWPGAIGMPSKYHAKFVLVLLFIALSSVLVVYIDIDT